MSRPRLLVLELWGLGDVALALPFLRTASTQADVTLLAKAHAAPLLARFAPAVSHLALAAPWTAFAGKYRLAQWPWRVLRRTVRTLRARRFDAAVTARRDPRDHVLLALSGSTLRLGFPRRGSGVFLTHPLPAPAHPHRAEHWRALAAALGWVLPAPVATPRPGRRIVIHPGAAHAVRAWPMERFVTLGNRLRSAGWEVTLLPPDGTDLDALLTTLAGADRFIGNDSGPGHLAAELGVPTFTIFGPQLPGLFAPQHPTAAWIDGAPCAYKPCFDACRFPAPHCIQSLTTADVGARVDAWLEATTTAAAPPSSQLKAEC